MIASFNIGGTVAPVTKNSLGYRFFVEDMLAGSDGPVFGPRLQLKAAIEAAKLEY